MLEKENGAAGTAPSNNENTETRAPSYSQNEFSKTDFSNSKKQAECLEEGFLKKRNNTESIFPLQRETPSPEPFPLAMLGNILGNAAQRVFAIVGAPDSVCGGSFLGAASLCVQPHRNVKIDGRTIALSEYFLSISTSGDRKSSTDKQALLAIRLYEEDVLKPEFLREMEQYRNLHSAWDSKRKKILRSCPDNMDELLQNLIEPKLPLEPIVRCEEPTVEGLQILFHLGRPSLGLFTDEGARFFGGFAMNQDNLSKTIAILSKLWDADGPITRVRAQERIQLYGRRLAAHLMLQPTIFQNVISNQILRDQGILARFLIAFPPQVGGIETYKKIDLSLDLSLKKYWARCSEILDISFPLKQETQNELDPASLELAPEAQKLWESFYCEVEKDLGPSGRYRVCYSFAKKVAEHAARIAGILECFDNLQAPNISGETMTRAVAIARWYLNESIRIIGVAEVDEELELAQKVLDFLRKKKDKSFHLRTIYKDGPNQVRTKKKAERIAEILVEHDYICRVSQNKGWFEWPPATTATCDKTGDSS